MTPSRADFLEQRRPYIGRNRRLVRDYLDIITGFQASGKSYTEIARILRFNRVTLWKNISGWKKEK